MASTSKKQKTTAQQPDELIWTPQFTAVLKFAAERLAMETTPPANMGNKAVNTVCSIESTLYHDILPVSNPEERADAVVCELIDQRMRLSNVETHKRKRKQK